MQAVKSDMTFCNVAHHGLLCHTLKEGLERNGFLVLFLECNTNKDDILKTHVESPKYSMPATLQQKEKQVTFLKA